MKRRSKIALFCLAAIVLNMLSTLLFFDVLHIPLFFDTIFTVAIVFYLGLVPGLVVGILFNFVDTIFNYLVRGIISPTNMCFSVCGAAIVLVTWAFARKKEEFQISVPVTILYLLLLLFFLAVQLIISVLLIWIFLMLWLLSNSLPTVLFLRNSVCLLPVFSHRFRFHLRTVS